MSRDDVLKLYNFIYELARNEIRGTSFWVEDIDDVFKDLYKVINPICKEAITDAIDDHLGTVDEEEE